MKSLQCSNLVRKQSPYSAEETLNRLEAIVLSKGATVFARIDHAAGAMKADAKLRPTAVLIFGNPKIGSVLMGCAQSTGIDLPQKALIWQDAEQQVWLTYNDPAYLKSRHAIEGCQAVLDKVTGALGKFAAKATAAE